MFNFQSGILDRARLFSNVLLIVLLSGNIFFSVQYIESLNKEVVDISDKTTIRIQASRFLKYFIDTVLNTKGAISFNDRVKLENDIRQMNDADILNQWNTFVESKTPKQAQDNAVKLMSMLTVKMI